MWRDILLSNADAVLDQVRLFRGRIDDLESAIENRDATEIEGLLGEAGALRLALEEGRGVVVSAEGPLDGIVELPGDKSISHRALILGALAHGTTEISGLSPGEDNASTLSVLSALGVQSRREGDRVWIEGRGFEALEDSRSRPRLRELRHDDPHDVRCSRGSSIRSNARRRRFAPSSADGRGSPNPWASSGRASTRPRDGRPCASRAADSGRVGWSLRVASAQVKTAVLLAGLQADGVTTVVEPAASRDHTERLLPVFGATIERPDPLTVSVTGPASLRGARVDIPADPSAAAFWLVAGSIVPGSRLELRGVSINPTRTGALDVLLAMGRPDHGDGSESRSARSRWRTWWWSRLSYTPRRSPVRPCSVRSTSSRPWRSRRRWLAEPPASPMARSCASKRATGSPR